MAISIFFNSFRRVISNERGVSLIEGLVGLGAVAGLAGVVMSLSTQFRSQEYIMKRACEAAANSTLEAITDEAMHLTTAHFTPSSVDQNITRAEATANLFSMQPSVADTDLWPAAFDIVQSQAVPLIQTHMLIRSSIRMLNTVSAAGAYCAAPAAYPSFTFANLGLTSELDVGGIPPNIQIQVEPIDLTTNTPNCAVAGTPIVVPSGLGAPQQAGNPASYTSATGNNGIITPPGPGAVLTDYAYRVTARVNYQYDGAARFCLAQKMYQYSKDSQAPPNPASVQITNTSTGNWDTEACQPYAAQASIQIDIDGSNLESGSLLFCRDTSQLMTYSSHPSLPSIACTGDGQASPNLYAEQIPDVANIEQPRGQEVAAEDVWLPCHMAKICGVDPTSVTPNNQYSNNFQLQLTYTNNIPRGCFVGLQVISVDSAGNVSDVIVDRNDIDQTEGTHITDPIWNGVVYNAGTPIDGPRAQQHRVVHRPYCGDDTLGVGIVPTLGVPGDSGIVDNWGVKCDPAAPATPIAALNGLTPNWSTTDPLYSGTTTSPSGNWSNEFPNGYYTCRNGGCCVGVGCTPWSN